MKVLVIVPDAGRYGGTIRFLERLLDIHSRQGITTTLLVPKDKCFSGLDSLAANYGIELVQSSNRTLPSTTPILTPIYDFLFIWRVVLARRPDLIVISTGDPGRLSISFYFPVPVLYILHSVPEQCFSILPRMYLWFGSMLNNRVMSVSHAAAESVTGLMGISRSKVEIVYNSCGDAPHRSESETPIILSAGHVVPYKNPEIWVEVARRVLMDRPDSKFIWLGDGELMESIREQVKRMSLSERILMPGYESNPSKWYAKAHIYFQPSLRESHGIAVLEAMAHGLPCVVANSGGLPESVVDEITGYVCPPVEPSVFSERIITLLDDAVLRERMGSAGRQRVKCFFSEKIQEQKIIALYERLTKNDKKH